RSGASARGSRPAAWCGACAWRHSTACRCGAKDAMIAGPMRADGERTLSEHASKALLAGYGVPVAREALVADAEAAARAAAEIGFPVVVKLCGDAVAHKTERSLVRLSIADAAGVRAAARELLAVGRGGLVIERADVRSVDVNPLIVRDGKPIAVDALAILGPPVPGLLPRPATDVLTRFRPLFHPCGVIVAGASSHPGKFGFAAFHNLLRFGFRGAVYPVNRDGGEILGRPCLRSVAEVPADKADLAFVCTPPAANVEMLRACAA